MKLNQLPKTTAKKKKRVGRGYGSRGGHTVGRGAKGFKARGKVPLTFDGTKIKKSFLKRLPLQRGRGKFKSFKTKPIIVKLGYLNLFPKGAEVDLEALIKRGIVDEKEAKKYGVKILGNGGLEVALKVALSCSQEVRKMIEKAGGELIIQKKKTDSDKKRETQKQRKMKKTKLGKSKT